MPTKKRIIYIAFARLPTEKAHGYQICKMCEAFARLGNSVSLLHPFRYQPNKDLERKSVFEYYDISKVFEVRTLPNIDLIWITKWFKNINLPALFYLNYFFWGLYAVWQVRLENAYIFYTRSPEAAFWLTRWGLPTAFEVHAVPKRIRRRLFQKLASLDSLKLLVPLTSFISDEMKELGFPKNKIITCAIIKFES